MTFHSDSVNFYCRYCNLELTLKVSDFPLHCACGNCYVIIEDGDVVTSKDLLNSVRHSPEKYNKVAREINNGYVSSVKNIDILTNLNDRSSRFQISYSIDDINAFTVADDLDATITLLRSSRFYYPNLFWFVFCDSSNFYQDRSDALKFIREFPNLRFVDVDTSLLSKQVLINVIRELSKAFFVLFVPCNIKFGFFSDLRSLINLVTAPVEIFSSQKIGNDDKSYLTNIPFVFPICLSNGKLFSREFSVANGKYLIRKTLPNLNCFFSLRNALKELSRQDFTDIVNCWETTSCIFYSSDDQRACIQIPHASEENFIADRNSFVLCRECLRGSFENVERFFRQFNFNFDSIESSHNVVFFAETLADLYSSLPKLKKFTPTLLHRKDIKSRFIEYWPWNRQIVDL